MKPGNNRKRAPVAAPAAFSSDEEDEYMGSDYEDSSEEIYEGRPTVASDAAKQQQGVPKTMLSLEDTAHMEIQQPQQMYMDISVVASPAQIQAGIESGEGTAMTRYQLATHVLDHLRENVAEKHKQLMTPQFLRGSVNRVIVNGFLICKEGNSFKFANDLVASHGFASSTVSQHGASLWRTAALTPVHDCAHEAWRPASIIQESLFDRFSMMTDKDLDNDIKLFAPAKSSDGSAVQGYAQVQISSPAYDKLVLNIKNRKLLSQARMSKEHVRAVLRPASHEVAVTVPYEIGVALRNSYKQDIDEFLDRCVDFETLVFEVKRADGVEKFTDTRGYVGEIIGAEEEAEDNAIATVAQKRVEQYYLKALISYRLVPGRDEIH